MKRWMRQTWELFVDDAWLAGLAVAALVLAALLVMDGYRVSAGLGLFLGVSAALGWRSRSS